MNGYWPPTTAYVFNNAQQQIQNINHSIRINSRINLFAFGSENISDFINCHYLTDHFIQLDGLVAGYKIAPIIRIVHSQGNQYDVYISDLGISVSAPGPNSDFPINRDLYETGLNDGIENILNPGQTAFQSIQRRANELVIPNLLDQGPIIDQPALVLFKDNADTIDFVGGSFENIMNPFIGTNKGQVANLPGFGQNTRIIVPLRDIPISAKTILETNARSFEFLEEIFDDGLGDKIVALYTPYIERTNQFFLDNFEKNVSAVSGDVSNTLLNPKEIAEIIFSNLGTTADMIAVGTFAYGVAMWIIKKNKEKHIPARSSNKPTVQKLAEEQIARLFEFFDRTPKSRVAEISLSTKIPEQRAVLLMKGLGFVHEPACFWHPPILDESILALAVKEYKSNAKQKRRHDFFYHYHPLLRHWYFYASLIGMLVTYIVGMTQSGDAKHTIGYVLSIELVIFLILCIASFIRDY